jgi:hypothetical protein
MGCDSSATLVASFKSDMAENLSHSDYAKNTRIEKSMNLYKSLQSNKEVKNSCSVVI